MKSKFIFLICLIIWIVIHIPAIFYGTKNLPLHQTYVGDEQSPVNGALHILEDKSLLALKDLKTVYYGPVFSLITIPAVVADFGEKILFEGVRSANDYKNILIWDWGEIVWKLRLCATIFTFLGLFGLCKLLNTRSVNPERKMWPVIIGILLLASNFYYFEYASFWKHWAIVVPVLVWQFYFLIRYQETYYERKYLKYSTLLFFISFGVSYLGIVFQVMWLPIIIQMVRTRNWKRLRDLFYYFLSLLLVVALVVAWHPRAFWRITGLVSSDIVNTDQSIYTSETSATGLSFLYYGMLIIKNHIALSIFSLISFFIIIRRKLSSFVQSTWMVPVILVGGTSFIIFGSMSHHESRYCLPVILSLVLFAALALPEWLWSSQTRNRWMQIVGMTLIGCQMFFHGVHIALINSHLAKGPVEERVINEIVQYEKANPEAKTLAVQYYLFGHVHTKEAYAAFASSTGKDDLNLYKEIAEAPLPKATHPINVYYIRPDDKDAYSMKIHEKYHRVILKIETHNNWLNQFDFFDEDLLRLWRYDDFFPTYMVRDYDNR